MSQDGLFDDDRLETTSAVDSSGNPTLYGLGKASIQNYVKVYLDLAKKTNGFERLAPEDILNDSEKQVILGGLHSDFDPKSTSVDFIAHEFSRLSAIPFDIENSITLGVYLDMRNRLFSILERLERDSDGFTIFTAEYVSDHSYMLPIFQRLVRIKSKAALKTIYGSVSDNKIPLKSAIKLADDLNRVCSLSSVNKEILLGSIEPTLEGIVRDLVGRYALESIVENALKNADVNYIKESDNIKIPGVIYDFRADFIVKSNDDIVSFIEVRKSSSRHASLYAKDKMFSAINWKGKNKNLLAVLITDGPWTSETLRAMSKVFDYIVPISRSGEVAESIAAYAKGDKTKLKWIIEFSITESPKDN